MNKKYRNNKSISVLIIVLIYLVAFVGAFFSFQYMPIDNLILKFLVSDLIATLIVYLFSLIFRNPSIYDPYWSVAPMVIVPFILWHTGSYQFFSIFVLALVELWGLRLTIIWLISFKNLNSIDWRYVQLKEKHPKLWPLLNILGICYLPTLVVFLGLMPIFAYFSTFATATSINILGFILSAVIGLGGVIIEGVADGQMLKFKKDPNNVGKINQTGLWKNSRHPNYFGEIAFWFSLFLFSMTISNRWVLLFCPLIVFLLFAFISIPMMEKRQLANKKGYDEYKKKTNLLLPIWPPQEKTNK